MQFQFPESGSWGWFALIALFPARNVFIQFQRFTQDDIPREQVETFNEVALRLAVLSDEWRALQVRVRLVQIMSSRLEKGKVSPQSKDAVV